MDKQSSEKRFALLIDADNVSAKYIKPITDELSNYGTVTIKRIYGDWTLSLHAKWKDALLENSLTPIQQFGYTQGKNATDSAMIIDAMDILYAGSVEGFCIVSSDSDFTRLASRLRESGRMVIGMGEKKTPTPFRRACDVFTTLELLLDDANGKRKEKGAGSGPSIEEVEQAVVRIITDNQNNGKATGLGEVGSRLLKRFPDFDVRSYGTNLLSKLLSKFSRVTITKNGSDVSVELADDKEPAKARQMRCEASGQAPDPIPSEEESAGAGDPGEGESSEKADEERVSAEGDQDGSKTSSRRRKRRGGTRRKIRAKQASGDSFEEGVADRPSEEDASKEEAVGDGRSTDRAPGETVSQAAPFAPVEEGAAEEDARDAGGVERRSVKRSRRRAVEAAEKGKDDSTAVGPDAGSDRNPAKEPSGAESLRSEHSGVRDAPSEVNATTRRLVAEAGSDGIDVSELASRVRAAHRAFKVRDFGYAQFKTYVEHFGDIEVERVGKQWFARMMD